MQTTGPGAGQTPARAFAGPGRRGSLGKLAQACVSACLATTAAASDLLSVETNADGRANSLALQFSEAPAEWDRFPLQGPPRLVIDLYGTTVRDPGALERSARGDDSALITGIRIGRHPGPRTRVVVDLAPGVDAYELVRALTLRVEASGQGERLLARLPPTSPAIAAEGTRQDAPGAGRAVTGPGEAEAVETAPGTSEASDLDSRIAVATANVKTQKTTERGSLSTEPVDVSDGNATDSRTGTDTLVFGAGKSSSTETVADASAGTRSSGTLVFGAGSPPAGQRTSSSIPASPFFVDRALIETGFPGDGRGNRGANTHTQFIAGVESALTGAWSARLSGRVDGQYQAGDLADLEWLRADYDESWVRFEHSGWRFTAGAQRILWGRVDEFSPTDRLSTRDFTRLIFDDLALRRRANAALRAEWSGSRSSLDLVMLPRFREAELPDAESIWFPFDAASGSVAGLPLDDLPRQLLRGARVNTDFDGSEGFGLRFSQTGSRLDYALTLQRVNNPEPYFTLGRPPTATQAAVLDVVYPRTWVVGGDAAIALGAVTLRGEAAWLSDSLYTDALSLMPGTSDEFNWVIGADFFPGGGDLRITTQLSGRHLLDARGALDFTDVTTFLGDVESPLRLGTLPLNARLRYSIRIDESATYLNPELAYTGFEPSVIYLGAHLFNGSYGTLEGFYQDRDQVVLGWRARF